MCSALVTLTISFYSSEYFGDVCIILISGGTCSLRDINNVDHSIAKGK